MQSRVQVERDQIQQHHRAIFAAGQNEIRLLGNKLRAQNVSLVNLVRKQRILNRGDFRISRIAREQLLRKLVFPQIPNGKIALTVSEEEDSRVTNIITYSVVNGSANERLVRVNTDVPNEYRRA